MLFNHWTLSTSRSVTHELFYPDGEIIHSTRRIRNVNYNLLSGSLLLQHTKIVADRPSLSSFSLEDISAPPISFLDAGSHVSYSFLGDKSMFEWAQITKPHQRRVRVRMCPTLLFQRTTSDCDWIYNNTPLATIINTTSTQLSNSGSPLDITSRFQVSNGSPSATKCAYTHVR